MLSVTDLTVVYRTEGVVKPVLNQISLSIDKAEIVGLVGPSGSGKTTLALCLLGLLPPVAEIVSGQVIFRGCNLHNADEKTLKSIRGKEIGAVFQEPGAVLNPVMRIDSQLCEGMRWHLGLTRAESRERAEQLLNEVGIPDPAGCLISYPHQLSGGMQQRVLIAAAIACQPKLLICDEPTSALDIIVQNRVLDLLKQLQENDKFSILLISHDLSAIERISERVEYLS